MEEDKSGTTIYIDRSTFLKEKNFANLWSLLDYGIGQNGGAIPSRSAKVRLQYDCAGERLRILSMTFHSGNMGLGKLIGADSSAKDWEAISLNSIGGATFDFACSISADDGSSHKFSKEEIPGWLQGPSTKVADVFFDPKSIKEIKGQVRMTSIINFKNPEKVASGFAWSAKTNVDFNCVKKTSRYSAIDYYDLPYGKGKVFARYQSSTYIWKPVSVEGLSMGMWNIACGNK